MFRLRDLIDDPWVRDIVAFGLACILIASSLSLAFSNVQRSPRHKPLEVEEAVAATPVFVPDAGVKVRSVPIPTPLLATYRSLPIHLPVRPVSVTVIAFHQAGSMPHALPLGSLVQVVKSSELTTRPALTPVTGPDESAEIEAAEATAKTVPEVYAGQVLRLWRSGRSGEPNTAVDCGSKPGAPVFAPVTGTVASVHRYMLYGQYEDYEIHILPKGWNDVDCCILHVADPSVRVGQQVVGGVTRIASVRRLSQFFDSQLDEYTHDGGNHVHIQIDRRPTLGSVELMSGREAEFGTPKERATPAPRLRPGAVAE